MSQEKPLPFIYQFAAGCVFFLLLLSGQGRLAVSLWTRSPATWMAHTNYPNCEVRLQVYLR